jgi:chaperonin cofactor prefoldin
MTVTGDTIATIIGLITLMAGGISVWVTLRERLARAETEIEFLQRQQGEHKTEVQGLREYLDKQFSDLRIVLAQKVDRRETPR